MTHRRRTLLLAAVTAAPTILAMVAGGQWRIHRSRTFQLFGELIPAVAIADSLVALTFDDGPEGPYTDSVLTVLAAHDARATFFVTGANVERDPVLTRRILEQGHELGNHTYTHRRMTFQTPRTVRREVELTDSLIRAAGVEGPIYFRPPWGKRLVVLPWYLARTDRATVMWSIAPDSASRRADGMVAHVLEKAQPGAIILLHVDLASRTEARASLPGILTGLQERGYRFVTVSQLVEAAAGQTGAGSLRLDAPGGDPRITFASGPPPPR